MMVVSSLGGIGRAPNHAGGSRLIASVDVEWTKNYRIKNGNRPFCYSIVYLVLPRRTTPVVLDDVAFDFTSVYVEDPAEEAVLVETAASELAVALDRADLLTGHQFTSDLAVLASRSPAAIPALTQTRDVWRRRREAGVGAPAVVDTRYDSDEIVGCSSRRLVDVCNDLRLDVTQPELRGTSMTALHRSWLTDGDAETRERVSVLNLRHSLSTALVALRGRGIGTWHGRPLNVNRMLAAGLDGTFPAWLSHPAFRSLM